MGAITAAMVKELREKTGAGMMDCKKALAATEGDLTKAVDELRKKGLATAKKRAGRETSEGTVCSYVHMGGKIGVLVEVNCETDFVAKNADFQQFAYDVAMHIAATAPLAVTPEEVDPALVASEKEIYLSQARETGKPENVIEKIVEGKLNKFLKESCLLNQPYVKDPDKTVQDYLNEVRAMTGENVNIRRFARFQLGQ
ncbi:MAG: translation elongation factor Ts [Desulfatibacillaceae bacterium]